MSDFETVARPYARALFELAREEDKLGWWSEMLDAAAQVVANDDMQQLIASPALEEQEIAEILISLLGSLEGVPEPTQELSNLFALMAGNGRLAALPAVASRYEQLKHEVEGVVDVQVRSARKLTAKQQKALEERLRQRFGKAVNLSVEIDKSLLAGAIIKAGDLVIDGSTRGRLDKLTSLLNK
jgi:F-type H+-transporting ATPase subunit delta